MDIWEHDGLLFERSSGYDLAGNAWHHELTALSSRGFVLVTVPDLTPDDEAFTPAPPDEVVIRFSDGTFPWPIWVRFLAAIRESDDLSG